MNSIINVNVVTYEDTLHETGTVVRETTTMLVVEWRGKEIRFSKKNGKPVGKVADRWAQWPYLPRESRI